MTIYKKYPHFIGMCTAYIRNCDSLCYTAETDTAV